MQTLLPWVCPVDASPLLDLSLEEAEDRLDGRLQPVARSGSTSAPLGTTPTVKLCLVHEAAFPVADDVPVLLAPEMLRPVGQSVEPIDLRQPRFAEAYAEMAFYGANRDEDDAMLVILRSIKNLGLGPDSFPDDVGWLDASYDGPAQHDCYRHVAPVAGRVVMQLGGGGLHAVKLLLAGASSAVVVTPMIAEARRARWLATALGVSDRLQVALGLAEQIPLPDLTVDAIFSGGCAHHMHMREAMPEIRRVLAPDGRFAAAEPWQAPFYHVGTRLFGKREANAFCHPLTEDRVAYFRRTFEDSAVVHHGAITRYVAIALGKAGIRPSLAALLRVSALDDRVSDYVGLRRQGSSVALLAAKG